MILQSKGLQTTSPLKNRSDVPLILDFFPEGSIYPVVKRILPDEVWDFHRKESYRNADYRCEICGGKGDKWPVEAHERWELTASLSLLTLRGLMSLCPGCHIVKHYPKVYRPGKTEDDIYAEVLTQIAKVNNWPPSKVHTYIEEVKNKWDEWNKRDWIIDLLWLDDILLEGRSCYETFSGS